MKVLVAHPGPHFSVADVHNGLIKGLRANGVDAREFNLQDRLGFYAGAHMEHSDGTFIPAFHRDDAVRMAAKSMEHILYEWWPDVVIVVSGFFVTPEVWAVLARRPHHVVLWCTESPYEDDRQLRPARYVDTVVVNDPTNLAVFRTAQPSERAWYIPHAYDPDIHHPGPALSDLACDFGFVGTGFPSRIDFFEQVDWTGVDARFGGNWMGVDDESPLIPMLLHGKSECLDNAVAAHLYRSAKVGANLYRKEVSEQGTAEGWAMGPREVELAACRTFFLREARAEGDLLFPDLPTFEGPDDFSEKMRWWLNHESEREAVAFAAHAAIADRTFTKTAAQLLRLVDGVGKTNNVD